MSAQANDAPSRETPVLPIRPELASPTLTDVGNAYRLVRRHGDHLRFSHQLDCWFDNDGPRWARDDSERVFTYARETVRDIYREAAETTDDSRRKLLGRHANDSEKHSRVVAMIAEARSIEDIKVRPEHLDADPWKLNVLNGTIDLRTGKLLPHQKCDLITKLVPITYDPMAECPNWYAFLARITDENKELISLLQRAFGYSLTGLTIEQCIFLLIGMGQNGKSKLLEILRLLSGDYGVQADFATFLDLRERPGQARDDIVALHRARVVTAIEVGEGRRFNESLLKQMTGEDIIRARGLWQKGFEFQPTFKLWLAANHKPVIRGTDNGIWRRIRLIPFTVEIPEKERDKNLVPGKLLPELSGILTWAVVGCIEWQRAKGLGEPKQVTDATEEYRKEMNPVGIFLEECCNFGPNLREPGGQLYRAYQGWAKRAGEYQLTLTAFGRKLNEKEITSEKDGLVYRRGVALNAVGLAALDSLTPKKEGLDSSATSHTESQTNSNNGKNSPNCPDCPAQRELEPVNDVRIP